MLPYACPRLETHICKAQGKHSLGEFFPHSEAGLVGPPSRPEVPQVSQAWLSTLPAGQEARLSEWLLQVRSGSYGFVNVFIFRWSWSFFLLPALFTFLRTECRQAECKAWTQALKCGSSNGKETPPASQGNL